MSLKIYTLSIRPERKRRRMSPRPPLRKRLPFNSTYGAEIYQTVPAEHVRTQRPRLSAIFDSFLSRGCSSLAKRIPSQG